MKAGRILETLKGFRPKGESRRDLALSEFFSRNVTTPKKFACSAGNNNIFTCNITSFKKNRWSDFSPEGRKPEGFLESRRGFRLKSESRRDFFEIRRGFRPEGESMRDFLESLRGFRPEGESRKDFGKPEGFSPEG